MKKTLFYFYKTLFAALLVTFCTNGFAQLSISSGSPSYSQNFDGLAATNATGITWLNNSTLPGWYLFTGSNVALSTYSAETGSTGNATFCSYGATNGGSERALGGLGSGGIYWGSPAPSAVAGYLAIAFTNSSGTTINSVSVGYNGEQWRKENNASAQTMVLQYGFGNTFGGVSSWSTPGGNYNWASPVTGATAAAAVNGNIAGHVSGRGGTLNSLGWLSGTTLWIRWIEVNDAGNDHALAIDDFTFSAVIPTTYTVTYNGNFNDGGTVPTDANSPYVSGSTVTVLGPGTMTKSDYTFAGWDSNNDGTAEYMGSGGETFTVSANTTLKAIWIPSGSPALSTSALTSFGAQCTGGSYGPNSFTITGSSLTADDVMVGPFSGFTFSGTAAGTYTNSLSLPQGGGTYSREIYVRFAPLFVGSYSGKIPVGGGGAANINVAASGSGTAGTPSVSTVTAGSVTISGASSGGNTISATCGTITNKGVVWSTSVSPTVSSNMGITDEGAGTSNYTSSISGLTPNTLYNYRAYVTNSNGITAYGTNLNFSTLKPESTNYPTAFACGTATATAIPLTWTDASAGQLPDGYLMKWSAVSYAAITPPVDGTAEADGPGVKNVAQGVQSYTAVGLAPNTPYYFKIWSYTNSGTNIDYKLVGESQTTCTTLSGPWEDFETGSNVTSYPTTDTNYTFTAGSWTFNNALAVNNDSGDEKNGTRAVRLRSNGTAYGYIQTNFNITTGLGNITINHANYGSDTGGKWQLKISTDDGANWNSVGSEVTSTATLSPIVIPVNQPGNVRIRIEKTAGTRINIDDIYNTSFSGTPEPNVNVQGSGLTIADGDATPSPADGTDFGTAIIAGTGVEKTFTLQNNGSSDLALDNPAIVLLDGSKGFVVSAQPVTNPMNAFTSQTFKISFSNTTPGSYTETVMIGSNDPDTPVYSFDVKAVVAAPSITSDKTSLTGFTYAFGQGPSSPLQNFVVNGSNLADHITVTASANWEISTNQTYDVGNSSPWSTITLNKTAGNAVNSRTVYVRLKDGLAVGPYTGIVTLSSVSAAPVSISLTGSVSSGIADIKVTGNGTNIPKNSTSPTGLNNTLFASQNIGNSQTKSFEIANVGGAALTVGTISISGADASAFTLLNAPASGTVLNQSQMAAFDIRFAPTAIGTKTATVTISSDDPNDSPYPFMIQGGATYCSSSAVTEVAQQGFESTPPANEWAYTTVNIGNILPGLNTGFSTGESGSGDRPANNKLYAEGSRGYRIQGADDPSQITSGVQLNFADVDVSSHSGIDLAFKVAGFSLGSVGNGIDCNSSTSGQTCVTDDLKADFVLVEISPDGGVNWYQQAKVVSDEMNLPWSFGSKGTGAASRAYAATNSLTYFKSTTALKYSAVTISNLPAVANLKVRITAQNNAINESWIIDDVKITSTGLLPKVWTGTAWTPSPPQPSDKAIISGDYNSEDHGGFTVCQCEIKNTATLTIAENTKVQVSDFMKNDGNIVVQPKGNFIQITETDSNSGTGTFRAIQNIVVGNHQQYNYLISPTENTNLKNVYRDAGGNTVPVPYVLYHDEKNNRFFNSSGAYIKGRALAVKEPATATAVTAVFDGKPANGAFSYTIVNSNPTNLKRGFNLIGNPYPSNMDLIKFYQDNSAGNNLSPTFYFWDNNANTQTAQTGDLYEGQAYATFNAATPPGTGTATKAAGDTGTTVLKDPTRYVKIAQGFMTQLENTGSMALNFSNSTRKESPAQGFFGRAVLEETQVDRYWLNMINSNNIATNIAMVYFDGGTDGFTREDSRAMGGSDAVYSMVDGEKVAINGKSTFAVTDKVALGTSHFADGDFIIGMDKTQGIFAGGQPVYLKDRYTGIITNLSEGDYSFTASAGESTGRFEIIYTPETVLSTEGNVREELKVYRDGDNFVIEVQSKKITLVEMYDATGRLIVSVYPNSTKAVLNSHTLNNGVYILRIGRSGEFTTRKIMK